MRFLIDVQLPPALARHLGRAGHQGDHVNAIGLGAASDAEIWTHAVSAGLVIITKDQDFAGRARQDMFGAQVVWVRLGNTTNRALWSALEPLLPEIIGALKNGERLIEIA